MIAEDIRAAIAAAERGNHPGRWPGKLPVAERLAVQQAVAADAKGA